MIDVHGLFARACGTLGWTPETFWKAQLYEVTLALDGERRRRGHAEARHAAWIINGVRTSIWSDNFSELETSDLYDPDYSPPTKEDLKQERDALAQQLPDTL